MKSDRELIELAKTKTLGAIAEQLNRSPAAIIRKATRLGVSIKKESGTRSGTGRSTVELGLKVKANERFKTTVAAVDRRREKEIV